MPELNKKLRILHIVLSIGETNAAYNQFCLPMAEVRDITICTYFKSKVIPPSTITVLEGDNSLRGFFRVLKAALETKEYDIIQAHSPHVALLFLIYRLFNPRRPAVSTVVVIHDSYSNFKLRNRLLLIPVFAAFQRIVCCSKASYASFPAFYKWLAGDRLRAVQNGMNITRVDRVAASVPRSSHKNGEFTVVAISRLVNIKNPFTLLSAFQQAADPTSRLIYMGDGILREPLLAKSGENRNDACVEFTGIIPRERVFENLLNADLYISTSHGEGLPISVLEAMACGCPVLLSDIPPHREIAEDVDDIPLVPPDDIMGFAREIKKFREMPAAERAAIGQRCRKVVEERFSLSSMQDGYLAIYDELLNHQEE